MSSLKRKHLDSSDTSDHENPVDQPFAPRNLPHPKRRRFDLARNLSRLSLFEQTRAQAPIVEEQAVFHESSPSSGGTDPDINISPWFPLDPRGLLEDTTMDLDGEVAMPVINHPIVEEPILIIPEVRMRHSSSYEPEKDRIVITDLDSSEDEAELPLQTSSDCGSPYSVSHAFLSRVNASKISIPVLKSPPFKLESDSSQALVLFKPSPWSAKDARALEKIYHDRDEEPTSEDQVEFQIEKSDADAMEIE